MVSSIILRSQSIIQSEKLCYDLTTLLFQIDGASLVTVALICVRIGSNPLLDLAEFLIIVVSAYQYTFIRTLIRS